MIDQAFEGDQFIWQEITALIKKWDIRTIIETGTEYGVTTARLSCSGLPVFTIECDLDKYNSRWRDLAKLGIVPLFGYSDLLIEPILRSIPVHHRILFYLDAHSNAGSPIRGELKSIQEHCIWPPVIVIHDCKVPNRDFGHDVYDDGTELTLDYFKDLLTWPHKFYYNDKAEGARRGVLYITPTE